MLLIDKDSQLSAPFKIPAGKQLTLLATGLAAGEKVTFELLALTSAGPGGDICCPGAVSLPDIAWSAPLKTGGCCDAPVAVELTSDMPYVVLSRPQEILLRAKVEASDDAVVEVHAFETVHSGSCIC